MSQAISSSPPELRYIASSLIPHLWLYIWHCIPGYIATLPVKKLGHTSFAAFSFSWRYFLIRYIYDDIFLELMIVSIYECSWLLFDFIILTIDDFGHSVINISPRGNLLAYFQAFLLHTFSLFKLTIVIDTEVYRPANTILLIMIRFISGFQVVRHAQGAACMPITYSFISRYYQGRYFRFCRWWYASASRGRHITLDDHIRWAFHGFVVVYSFKRRYKAYHNGFHGHMPLLQAYTIGFNYTRQYAVLSIIFALQIGRNTIKFPLFSYMVLL